MNEPRDVATSSLSDLLRKFDTPTISNAIERLSVRDRTEGYASAEIRCMYPELDPLVGYAVTCTSDSTTGGPQRASRLADLIDLLTKSPKPTVIVCQYVGSDRSRGCFVGDLAAALFSRLGAVGVVTDAPNRDLALVRRNAPGFQVFGLGSVASHGNGAVLDVGVPVVVGGMRVRPGDLIHGDASGVITVPLEVVDKVAAEAERVGEAEKEILALVADQAVPLSELKRRFTH